MTPSLLPEMVGADPSIHTAPGWHQNLSAQTFTRLLLPGVQTVRGEGTGGVNLPWNTEPAEYKGPDRKGRNTPSQEEKENMLAQLKIAARARHGRHQK